MKIMRNFPAADWDELITKSHQTSLFVMRDWLALYQDSLDILAAYDHSGNIIAGLVTQLTPEPLPFVPYQGLLLTRREMPGVARALLEEAERIESHIHITNAPSLVDIRPFKWRWNESSKLWSDSVHYTMLFDATSRPFDDIEDSSEPEELDLDEDHLPRFIDSVGDALWPIMELPSVKIYTNTADEMVVWGTDRQNRGYYIAGTPRCSGLVVALAKRHEQGADLYGCNSPSMNKRKRVYGAKLRTYYRLDLRK